MLIEQWAFKGLVLAWESCADNVLSANATF